jgi:hypothetical protein
MLAVAGDIATVGGGYENIASGVGAVVAGGVQNEASNVGAVVAGGGQNIASGIGSMVGAGEANVASGTAAVISGGGSNSAGGQYATVGGGYDNSAPSESSTVGGGAENSAGGQYATVGGGYYNIVPGGGDYSTIPGGYANSAAGTYSFAAGRQASANYDGCFVWGDSTNGTVSCGGDDRFVVRASGGITMYTSGNLSTGATLPAGSGSWSSLSDRNAKSDIAPVDTGAILAALAALDVSRWSYSASPGVTHIGPMAQDFYTAFGYGDSDRYISSVDADGVALAAIQALLARLVELEARVAHLEAMCQ